MGSHVHIDKSPDYRLFEPWLGDGLLISTGTLQPRENSKESNFIPKNPRRIGEKWRAHRKLIAPTFHLNVLKSFINVFNKNSRAIVEKMRKHGDKDFDIHEYMGEATVEILLGNNYCKSHKFVNFYRRSLNILVETAMGVDKGTQQDREAGEYVTSVMK